MAWTRRFLAAAAAVLVLTPAPANAEPFALSGAVAQRTVTVDAAEPVTAIDSHPPLRTNLSIVSFTYSANEPATFTCRLRGPGHEADEELSCPGGRITYEGLASGDYTFGVRAINDAGTADAS